MRTALIAALLASLHAATASFAARLVYPVAPRSNQSDDFHGTVVADPYRWLEESDSPASVGWIKAEIELTNGYLAGLPGRDRIHKRLDVLVQSGRTGVPWREGGRIFYLATSEDQPQPILYVMDDPKSAPQVFFDPNVISPDGSLAIGDYVVSPDGHLLCFAVSEGGADVAEIRVRDVAAGKDTGDVVQGLNACWTRDSRGFFYARSFRSDAAGAARTGVRAFHHRLGEPASSDRQLMEWGAEARWLYFMASEDGRWALMVAEKGMTSDIRAIDLGDPAKPDVGAAPFQALARLDAFHNPVDWVGSTLYARTNHDAPRTRIVAVDLAGGADAGPRTVVPESGDVIVDAVITGGRLVVNYLHDVHSALRLFDLDGKPQGEIALPGLGAVGWPLGGRPSMPELFFSYESPLSPPAIQRCDVVSRRTTTFRSTRAAFDAGRYETTQVFYPSKDGTRVPMFVTAAKKLKRDGSHPVFITAYGGYGSTMEPRYSPGIPLWLEMGGIYVVANIRGGGEYGEEWHRAGMLDRKQTSFDDFIAAAEYLVKQRYTTPKKIAIYGQSNGGLLIGAVLTQRPDLFGAAVANAGHYDMLRYHKFTAGAGWVTEYGSPDDSTAFQYLRAYSPLQNVREGTCYPATLLLAADHDDRVVPAHAYKFAAALQAAQSCDAPVLLRIAVNASHSYSSREEMIAEHADMWAFIRANLGLSP